MLLSLTLLTVVSLGSAVTPPSVCMIIRSQPNSYFIKKAEALKGDVEAQAKKYNADIKVIMAHEEYASEFDNAWSLLPIMPQLAESHAKTNDWIMFVEEGTVVNVENLMKTLSKFDSTKDLFLARGLFDKDMVIIHHFTRRKAKNGGPFLYPDFEAGWVLSSEFVKKVGKKWNDEAHGMDFQIDVKHEIALHFSNKFDVEITEIPEFCGAGVETSICATNVIKDLPVCDDKLTIDDIFVGVKTTLKFHKDRVKVVMDTWGPKVKHMILYSNVTDPSIPTVDCGVENTVRGHCGKTDAMLKDFYEMSKISDYKWFVIADDDTIMSVARLVQFLNCFDPEEPVFLGEKYGYGLTSKNGYAYITGGGGMIFSKPAVETWVNKCHCPSIDSPDDMLLGNFLGHFGVPSIHSPLFHQARPEDYAEGYLSNQTPISFHKHWEVDPIKVYRTWFEKADSGLQIFDHVQMPMTTTPALDVIPTPLPPTPLDTPRDEL